MTFWTDMRRSAAAELGRRHASTIGLLMAAPRILAAAAVLALVAGVAAAGAWLVAHRGQVGELAGDVAGAVGGAAVWLLVIPGVVLLVVAAALVARWWRWRRFF